MVIVLANFFEMVDLVVCPSLPILPGLTWWWFVKAYLLFRVSFNLVYQFVLVDLVACHVSSGLFWWIVPVYLFVLALTCWLVPFDLVDCPGYLTYGSPSLSRFALFVLVHLVICPIIPICPSSSV